jgi:hypothetical protein
MDEMTSIFVDFLIVPSLINESVEGSIEHAIAAGQIRYFLLENLLQADILAQPIR